MFPILANKFVIPGQAHFRVCTFCTFYKASLRCKTSI